MSVSRSGGYQFYSKRADSDSGLWSNLYACSTDLWKGMQIPFYGEGYESIRKRPADIKQRMDLFYAYMDENNYKEADKV